MDKSGYNIIWKMSDVKQYDTLWTFTDADFIDLFIDGVETPWYDRFLNDVVDDLVLSSEKPSIIEYVSNNTSVSTGSFTQSDSLHLTDDEYEAYIEWSNESSKVEDTKRPPINFDFIFEPESDFGITVALIGDKLTITSEDIKVLDDIKEIFIKAGNICCDHHKKTHKNVVFHTYVFIIDSKI
jgi:hypothetical protein|tara:strand:+ start:521 stop:1069 length:549 start_codon:yes stop_codon:yes gene_type:complete